MPGGPSRVCQVWEVRPATSTQHDAGHRRSCSSGQAASAALPGAAGGRSRRLLLRSRVHLPGIGHRRLCGPLQHYRALHSRRPVAASQRAVVGQQLPAGSQRRAVGQYAGRRRRRRRRRWGAHRRQRRAAGSWATSWLVPITVTAAVVLLDSKRRVQRALRHGWRARR